MRIIESYFTEENHGDFLKEVVIATYRYVMKKCLFLFDNSILRSRRTEEAVRWEKQGREETERFYDQCGPEFPSKLLLSSWSHQSYHHKFTRMLRTC